MKELYVGCDVLGRTTCVYGWFVVLLLDDNKLVWALPQSLHVKLIFFLRLESEQMYHRLEQTWWCYFMIALLNVGTPCICCVQVPLFCLQCWIWIAKLQWVNLDPIVIFVQQVRDNELPGCVEKSMYFCEHTSSESASKDHSKRNRHEAGEITEVAKTFCQEGRVDPSKITVLCAYRGQASV